MTFEPGRPDLLEEVLVDLDEVNRTLHLHSDPVLDHELGEQGPSISTTRVGTESA